MYHRRTAVFLLSSGIFKTHEERPGRLVEFTLCHVVACRPIRRFSPVKACYRPFSQITRSYFRVSFPYMHHPLLIYLFIYLKIRTMYRGENNRTRSPLLGSPSYSDPIKCRKTNPLPQKTRIKY